MIYTSNYENFKGSNYRTNSISWGKGVEYDYDGKSYMELAPLKSFWRTWKDNIGKISEEENNKYYIEQYYDLILSKLDVEKVYNDLDNSVLLCYEDNNLFCHRHIVAAWFELLLDVKVPEVKIVEGKIVEIEKPEYIKEYLEEIIKRKTNMKGFNYLRALYLFEEGNKFDAYADSIIKNDKASLENFDRHKQYACYLRCMADEAEAEYNKNNNVKKKTYQ